MPKRRFHPHCLVLNFLAFFAVPAHATPTCAMLKRPWYDHYVRDVGVAWNGSGFNSDIYFYSWSMRKVARSNLSRSVMQAEINGMVPDRINHIGAKVAKKWRLQ